MPEPLAGGSHVAALWEHPTLCIGLFGAQFHTPEGQRLYEEAGIQPEMDAALQAARSEGLLLNRTVMTPEGPLLIQYWRSYEDLDRWARTLPHTRWWKWLMENVGNGVGFYHEVYQVRTAEAIYEEGTIRVGPAQFCSLEPVGRGEGRSRQRQERFAEAARVNEAADRGLPSG